VNPPPPASVVEYVGLDDTQVRPYSLVRSFIVAYHTSVKHEFGGRGQSPEFDVQLLGIGLERGPEMVNALAYSSQSAVSTNGREPPAGLYVSWYSGLAHKGSETYLTLFAFLTAGGRPCYDTRSSLMGRNGLPVSLADSTQ